MGLKKMRLAAAFLALCVFTSLFLAPGVWTTLQRKAILASQFTPATARIGYGLLAAAGILAATFLLGRVYCSVLCPAGLAQELFHRLGGVARTRGLRFVRGGRQAVLLAAVVVAAALGCMAVVNFLDPLGLFGRLASLAGGTVSLAAENVAALMPLALGAVLLVVVPLFRGRWFCDRLCPVGALLGLVSASGGGGVSLDPAKCVSCGRCEKICPVRTIDAAGKRVEPDRCVLCLDCLDQCPVGALSLAGRAPENRRGFLRSAAAATAGGLFVLARPMAESLGAAGDGRTDILPPGAGEYARHAARCVSCQACVPACPVGIIRPRGPHLRPALDYDRGYCQYGCADCTHSCPAGALLPMTPEAKQTTRLARTELQLGRCVVIANGTACGACAEVCPTHAVRMVERDAGLPTVPDFSAAHCIGCGACYHVCPAEPRAFTLEGLVRQETAAGVRPGGHGEPREDAAAPDGGDRDALQEFPF